MSVEYDALFSAVFLSRILPDPGDKIQIDDLQFACFLLYDHTAVINFFYQSLYATGFSSAVAIAEHILTTGDASGYLKFLTTGGSDYPLEELKIAGIDLTKPDTVRSALRVFDEIVDELSALLL